MQWKGKIVSAGQREDICSYQFLDISVTDLPVPISQKVFEDINSSFTQFKFFY